jgi:hypothetical protein
LGDSGSLVFDSKVNDLDKRSNDFGTYDDGRTTKAQNQNQS